MLNKFMMRPGPRYCWLPLLLGFTSTGAVAADAAATTDQTGPQLEEVVVTAQKRSERLVDVPVSITAISGEDLQALHVEDLADLAYQVPGLNVVSGGAPGFRTVIIRGLYDGNAQSGVPANGMYLDDLSIGWSSSSPVVFGIDLNPFDIDHIEVLKGPQGTLYGANTVSGLIKYSSKQPNLNTFDAQVGGGIESIAYSESPSWAVRGAVNLPIVADTLALRVSAFDKSDAGYIDNLYTGQKGFNSSREDGGMATLLWKPSDRISVKAMVVVQDVDAESVSIVSYNTTTREPAYGSLAVNTPLLNPLTNSTRVYSLNFDWRLDFATLTSTSGWTTFKSDGSSGLNLGFFCVPGILGLGYPGCPDYPHPDALIAAGTVIDSDKFVQEIRLASPEHQRLQWLVGGFFTRETMDLRALWTTYTPQLVQLPPENDLVNALAQSEYKETAGFADLTFNLTDRLDLSAGGRYTSYSITNCTPEIGGSLNWITAPQPCTGLPSTGVAIWMTNASFHFNSDEMLYARIATGYRPGFGCPTCNGAAFGLPGIIEPDKSTNYELGFKGIFLDGRFQVDTDVYHILWRNMQLAAFAPNTNDQINFPVNVGTATSNGWELAVQYQVTEGLRLAGVLGYTHAYLTQDVPGIGAKDGDSLPSLLPWSASLRADYSRPLTGHYTWLLGGNYKYRDSSVQGFGSNSTPPLPVQNLLDLYTGLGTNNAVVRLYAANVFNKFSVVNSVGSGDTKFPTYVPIQPRTLGLSFDYKF